MGATVAMKSHGLFAANRTAFLVMGAIEAAWAPLVPYVKSAYGLDESQLGVLLLCSGLGAMAGMPMAGPLCMRQGARGTVLASGVVLATMLLLVSLFPGLWATALMLIVFGVCTTLIDVSANINGIAVEKLTGRHLMSGFHGGYSLGTLLGAGAMSVFFSIGMAPMPAVVICMVLTVGAMMWFCRSLLNRDALKALHGSPSHEETKEADVHTNGTETDRDGIFPIIMVGMLCFIMYASEGAVMSWSAVFVSQERGVDLAHAGFFYTAFAVMMTLVRLYGDKAVSRLGRRRVVSFGALLVTVGFASTALIPNVPGTVFGFALVGIGAANIVPQLVSFAGGMKGMTVANIISTVNAIGYSGILLGPVIIGFVAKHYGLPTAFLGIAACCLALSLTAWRIMRRELGL